MFEDYYFALQALNLLLVIWMTLLLTGLVPTMEPSIMLFSF